MIVDRCVARDIIGLSRLALRLGRIERVTYHPDGKRRETDSDHTVVLGLTAPAFASRFLPQLRPDRVAAHCLVHDLVEAYAGDTDSFAADEHGRAYKQLKEHMAARRIHAEFDTAWPWVTAMLALYEGQIEPEARFVWAFDKIMPAVTHILNGGAYLLRDAEATVEDVARFNARETARINERVQDMPAMIDLYAIMKALLIEHVYGEGTSQ